MYLSCRLTAMQNIFSVILKCALVPVFISYGYLYGSPDLLMLAGYLWFVFLFQGKIYPYKKYSSVWMGIAGALLYFTKGFGFYFFISVFTAINLFLFIRTKEFFLVRKYITAILL